MQWAAGGKTQHENRAKSHQPPPPMPRHPFSATDLGMANAIESGSKADDVQ